MATRWARVARGLVAASLATFVAALFHGVGGGGAPSGLAITLSLTFSALAAIALTGRRASLWRLTASVIVSQFLFHVLFSLGPTGTTFAAADGSTHLHAGSHLISVAGQHAHMSGLIPQSPLMWLSHASAALVTIVALRFGERAFWGLFETTRMRLARFARIPLSAPVGFSLALPAIAIESEPAHLRDLGLLLGRMRHRGPPTLVSTFA